MENSIYQKWEEEQIEMKKNYSYILIPEKLLLFFEDNKGKFVDYKFYIDKENKFFKELENRTAANRPKGMNPIEVSEIKDFDIEKSFEWEDVKKP